MAAARSYRERGSATTEKKVARDPPMSAALVTRSRVSPPHHITGAGVELGSTLTLTSQIPMKPSTTNIARGNGNIAAGKTKEIAGKVVNSPKLEAKGDLQQAGGQIQKAVGKAQKSQGD